MVVSKLPTGTAWVTGDATRLATSPALWPAVNPHLTEEQRANYSLLADIKKVYKDFWWMGYGDELTAVGQATTTQNDSAS